MTDTTALPTLNVPLLRDIVTWAAAWDRGWEDLKAKYSAEGFGEWNQNVWFQEMRNGVCKTACCIAGETVATLGYKPILERDEHYYDDDYTSYSAVFAAPAVLNGLDAKGNPIWDILEDSKEEIRVVARRGLGLTDSEAAYLFEGDNTIEQVVAYALLFAKARHIDLDLPVEVEEIGRDMLDSWTRHDLTWRFGSEYVAGLGLPSDLDPVVRLKRFALEMRDVDAIGDDQYNTVLADLADIEARRG